MLSWGSFHAFQAISSSRYFMVQKVDVQAEENISKEKVLKAVSLAPQSNLFRLNLAQIRTRIEQLGWVKEAVVSRQLPNTLRVNVKAQKAKALLNYGHLRFINEEGKPFASVGKDLQDLPLVSIQAGAKWDESMQNRVQLALKIIDKLAKSENLSLDNLNEIWLRNQRYKGGAPILASFILPGDDISQRSNSVMEVSFNEAEIEKQMARLDAVVKILHERGKEPRRIRLELGKKVVVKIAQ